MAKNRIATAYVQVMPSMDGVAAQVRNHFSSVGNSSGSTFGSNLVSKIKGIIAGAGFGAVLKTALTAGGDLQQSLGGIETLFKENAATVIAHAEQAYKTAGMSANGYMEQVTSFSASLLQSLSGDTAKAAAVADMAMTDMSDNANKMGTDMERITDAYQGFAKQNYTMLDNLKLGYGGTKTEMERLLADAEKLSGVKYDISNLSDVYSAIHVIQDELGITGTTALEASATFSGSFAAMKAAATNVLGNLALGEDIGPSLTALGDSVYTFMVGNLLPMVGNVLQSLPDVIESALGMVIWGLHIAENNAEAIVQMGVELVTGIGSAILTAAPYLVEAAIGVVAALGNTIISTDWKQVATDTITDMRSSLDLAAGEILGTDGNIVQSVLDAISNGLPSILESGVNIVAEIAEGLLSEIPAFLGTAGDMMNQLLETVLSILPDIFSSGISLVSELASGLISNLPSVIKSGVSILAELLATIASHLPDLLAQGIALIGELAAGLIAAIPDLIASIPEIIGNIVDTFGEWDWGEIGSNIISGIAKGITSAAGEIWEAAKSAAQSALKAAKEALGIASPSRRFRDEVGKQVPPGIALGIRDTAKQVYDAVDDISENMLAKNLRIGNGKVSVSGATSGYGKVVNVVQNIYSEAKTAADLMQEARYQQELAVMFGV